MRGLTVTTALFFVTLLAQAAAEEPPRFSMPIDCEIGSNCFIQNYVDHQRGAGYQDYHCGFLTNDRHTGTDFRLPDHESMANGVAVLAAAAGTVSTVRDGMPDVDVRLVGKNAVNDRGLGNAVVIDHDGGWRTLYGHMQRNSIVVAEGAKVARGQKLGLIGLSGLTEYPHVHFEVRYNGKVVDPFVGLQSQTGCAAGEGTLWQPDVLARLRYKPTFLLSVGFSDHSMTRPALQYGLYDRGMLPRRTGSLYFGVFFAGLYAGDRYTLQLSDEAGRTLKTQQGVFDQPAAVHFRSIGIKRNGPLPGGKYRARFTLNGIRDGKPDAVIDVERSVSLQ